MLKPYSRIVNPFQKRVVQVSSLCHIENRSRTFFSGWIDKSSDRSSKAKSPNPTTDAHGNLLSSNSSQSIYAYDRALLDYLRLRNSPSTYLEEFLKDDVAFPMAHCLTGISNLFWSQSVQEKQKIDEHLKKAKDLISNDIGTAREKTHVMALEALTKKRYSYAANLYESILSQNPMDLLALRCCHDIYLHLGDKINLRASIARVLPEWNSGHNGYDTILGMQAYAFQENGLLNEAKSLADYGLSIVRDTDGWGVNALLHVYESRAEQSVGISYLSNNRDNWTSCHLIFRHIYFHWANFLMETGGYAQIQSILLKEILQIGEENKEVAIQQLVDASYVLWRLHLVGYGNEEWMQKVARMWQSISNKDLLPVERLSKYCLLLLTNTIDESDKDLYLSNQNDLSVDEKSTIAFRYDNLVSYTVVYNTLLEGIKSYCHGNYSQALAKISSTRHHLDILGVNNNDKDLFLLLLADSALKHGDLRLSQLYLNERLSLRPGSGETWSMQSKLLRELNETEYAEHSAKMAHSLGYGQRGSGAH